LLKAVAGSMTRPLMSLREWPLMRGPVFCIDVGLQLAQLFDHRIFFLATQPTQQFNHPLLMARRHFAKSLEAGFSQLHRVRAAVSRLPRALHQPFTLKLIGDSRYVPS